MLHEVLTALLGHTGDVIKSDFTLALGFPNLHPSERQVIERLARLGQLYSQISAFKARAYIFDHCLKQSIEVWLDDYRNLVVGLEEELMVERASISTLATQLDHYQFIFTELHGFLEQLRDEDKGIRLLNLLHQKVIQAGNPLVREMFCTFRSHLLRVVGKQLMSWIFYSSVRDPYDEFMIIDKVSDSTYSSESTIVGLGTI